MSVIKQTTEWLETNWVNPAYGGFLLAGIAICFFGAATNTMAGWLYVISAIIFALLVIAAILPMRSLNHLSVRRRPISPVSVGDQLTIELEIENPTLRPQTLLEVQDMLPPELGAMTKTPVASIPAQSVHRWVYYHPTAKRGVYRWHQVQLRTATPLGLFWCRRRRYASARAVVYPTVLPLTRCPLVDEIGKEDSMQVQSDRKSQSLSQDLTKALRPYRVGDPTRLIHWRTSARYGELLVRELEVLTGSQEIIICLDSSSQWHPEDFEQAVIAAASMYSYACRTQPNVKFWTPITGLLHGNSVVLEALAATQAGVDGKAEEQLYLPPYLPLIWLTQNPVSLNSLPPGSRCLLWPKDVSVGKPVQQLKRDSLGIVINTTEPLKPQLQQPIR